MSFAAVAKDVFSLGQNPILIGHDGKPVSWSTAITLVFITGVGWEFVTTTQLVLRSGTPASARQGIFHPVRVGAGILVLASIRSGSKGDPTEFNEGKAHLINELTRNGPKLS